MTRKVGKLLRKHDGLANIIAECCGWCGVADALGSDTENVITGTVYKANTLGCEIKHFTVLLGDNPESERGKSQ